MKQPIFYLILLLFLLSCSSSNENPYLTEQINNSTFQYKLEDGKLTDTLKVFDLNGKLVFLQNWRNGKLEQTSIVDETGKIRNLEFYERKDSSSTTQYYFDKNDTNFKRFPFTKDMFDFYEKHCFLSQNSISKDTVNKIDLFNYPIKHAMIAVNHGIVSFENGKFMVTPKLESSDTMKVFLNNPMTGNFSKEFHLIVK